MPIERAFVQVQRPERPEVEAQALLQTLAARGIRTEAFAAKRLQRRQLPLERGDLVAGDLDVMRTAFRILGIDGPFLATYPKALRPRMGRGVWEATVSEVHSLVEARGPMFVKPLEDAKRFSGFVFGGRNDGFGFAGASQRLRVLCSDVVSFAHEIRMYVVDGEVVASAAYAGTPQSSLLPFANECIDELRGAGFLPRGFAIDIGVLASGEVVVVECNEGFGLGLYPGVDFAAYTELICARWEELVAG
ncbi:MAG: ATP-grasp domain-containing protein [Myxococcota bacterium]